MINLIMHTVGGKTVQTTNATLAINRAINEQAEGKPVTVNHSIYGRVFKARTRKGQFQIHVGSGQWCDVKCVKIERG